MGNSQAMSKKKTPAAANRIRYNLWLEANKGDMLDMWESMGIVERYEEGGDFDTFCELQFDNGYGQ